MALIDTTRRVSFVAAITALGLVTPIPLTSSAVTLERSAPGSSPPAPVFTDMDNYLDRAEYQQFLTQEVRWSPDVCGSSKAVKLLPDGDDSVRECARVNVPMDWHDISKGTIQLGIARVASDADDLAAHRKRLMFMNPGGPGVGGIMQTESITLLSGTKGTHIGIGVDPRGVGLSTELQCPAVPKPTDAYYSDGDSRTFDWAGVQAANRYQSARVAACNTVAPHYKFLNTEQTARDFTFIRELLGYKTADFHGGSYGTRLGSIIGRMFPNQFERIVLDANTNQSVLGQEGWKAKFSSFQFMFDNVALPYYSRHHDQFGLGDTPVAVERSINQIRRRAAAGEYGTWVTPDDIDAYALKAGQIPFQLDAVGDIFKEFLEATPEEPEIVAESEHRRAISAISANSLMNNDTYQAVMCGDEGRSTDPEQRYHALEANARNMPLANREFLVDLCTGWEGSAALTAEILNRPLRNTLFVHYEGDAVTSYKGAMTGIEWLRERGDAKTLRFISVDDGVGHVMYHRDRCASPKVATFLRTGELPATDIACQAGPLPYSGERVVYELGHDRRSDTEHSKPYQYVMRDIRPAQIDQAATAAWQAANPVEPETQQTLDVPEMAHAEQLLAALDAVRLP